jgi:hypothetical protein
MVDAGGGPIPFFFGAEVIWIPKRRFHGEVVDFGFDQLLQLAGGFGALLG